MRPFVELCRCLLIFPLVIDMLWTEGGGKVIHKAKDNSFKVILGDPDLFADFIKIT